MRLTTERLSCKSDMNELVYTPTMNECPEEPARMPPIAAARTTLP